MVKLIFTVQSLFLYLKKIGCISAIFRE